VNGGAPLRVPGDKSISHRALMFAALARGESRLRGVLDSADTRATAAALRALGADISELGAPEVTVVGRGMRGLRAPARPLDCGNSGTTARLLLGMLAGAGTPATLPGDESLRARPMRRVTDPLAAMGATFEELGTHDRLPLRVLSGTRTGLHFTSPRSSAQVKSALLLAGLTSGAEVSVTEPRLSRDHTERLLETLGCSLRRGGNDRGVTVLLPAAQSSAPFALDVPGDISSAAFMLAFGVLGRRAVVVSDVGVNPTRTGLLGVLKRMGAPLALRPLPEAGREPVAVLEARPATLKGTHIRPEEVPSLLDELPVFAVLAARAQGESVVRGAGELRVKETDRISAIVDNLARLGVEAEELEDGFRIVGTDRPLGGRIVTHWDHRIAMAFGVLAALPGSDITIDAPGAVDVSYPGFWDHLARAAGSPA
jgi:3-phosphoshikimate 1-carboxyvinyltransferase